MTRVHWPTPEQIRAYLAAHGWTPDDPLSDLVIFTYKELSDDGQPITVGVPDSMEVIYYPLRVKDLVVTVAWVEGRPEPEVFAEILATNVPPASQTSSSPAA